MQSGHARNVYNRVRNQGIGPGGWHCTCCGPAPKYRRTWMRKIRRRMKRLLRHEVEEQLAQG